LKTDVELRLRKAGVQIKDIKDKPTVDELMAYEVTPRLEAVVSIVQGKSTAAAGVVVNLKRIGRFGQDRSQIIFATVWTDGTTILSGMKLEPELRQQVGDIVDAFINDYLAANPKP
jgi:hypothetical protein